MVLFTGPHLGWYVLPIKISLKKILAPSRNSHPKSSTKTTNRKKTRTDWNLFMRCTFRLIEGCMSPTSDLPNRCLLVGCMSWLQLFLNYGLVVQKSGKLSSCGWQFIPFFTSLYTSQVVVWDFLLSIPNKIHVCMVYLPIHEWLILWFLVRIYI